MPFLALNLIHFRSQQKESLSHERIKLSLRHLSTVVPGLPLTLYIDTLEDILCIFLKVYRRSNVIYRPPRGCLQLHSRGSLLTTPTLQMTKTIPENSKKIKFGSSLLVIEDIDIMFTSLISSRLLFKKALCADLGPVLQNLMW
jgi:hypothetical protein